MYYTTITTITIILSNSSSFACIKDTLNGEYYIRYDDGSIRTNRNFDIARFSVGQYPCITSTGLLQWI